MTANIIAKPSKWRQKFERICPSQACQGKGKIYENNPERVRECQVCNGKGKLLTTRGFELLQMVDFWMEES